MAVNEPRQLEYALILLRRLEYLNGRCAVCGWPQEGHGGPGRYKGNAENTHEAGCSLDAILHGEPAPRLDHLAVSR